MSDFQEVVAMMAEIRGDMNRSLQTIEAKVDGLSSRIVNVENNQESGNLFSIPRSRGLAADIGVQDTDAHASSNPADTTLLDDDGVIHRASLSPIREGARDPRR